MRIKRSLVSRKRRRKLLNTTKGYWGRRKNNLRKARETLIRALAYAYRDRKQRKRDFRTLWISRINAAVVPLGLSYSKFMGGLRKAGVELNRKTLSEMAIRNPDDFKAVVEVAKEHVN